MTTAKDNNSTGPQESQARYIRNSRTISGSLHDELVMMDIKQGKYFSLNTVATRIWVLLEQPRSVEELCRILVGEYEVEYADCLTGVSEYLSEMRHLGLVFTAEE
jgi:hypothetical protein